MAGSGDLDAEKIDGATTEDVASEQAAVSISSFAIKPLAFSDRASSVRNDQAGP